MVILFLLALLLAWPTAGLSIVAFVVFIGVKAYLKSKARMHYSNTKNAETALRSGEFRFPSWALNSGKTVVFVETVQQLAELDGVPKAASQGILTDQDGRNMLLLFAGAMEQEGASFVEQQAACAEKLVRLWNRLSTADRNEMLEKGHKEVFDDDDIPF